MQYSSENIIELGGHVKMVKSMAWSPYKGGMLVSVGEDGLALVWDVITKSVIAAYAGHNCEPILSVIWSPLHEDFIITGAKNNTINIWKVSDYPPKPAAEILAGKRKHKKKLKFENLHDIPQEILPQNKSYKKTFILNRMSKYQSESSFLLEDCRRLLSIKNQAESCPIDAVDQKEDGDSNEAEKLNIFNIFGDREDITRLLNFEQKQHKLKGKYALNQQISLWKGEIGKTIKEAIKDGSVTPWLINMAPMVSSKLWQEACEAYTKKLKDNAKVDPLELSTYYLACHEVEEAIQCLCNGNLYREALALAKYRLPASDPIMNEILERWAFSALYNGSYQIAAQCFVVLGKYEDATKALNRRSDVKSLELAAEIAQKCENKDLYNAVMFRLDAFRSAEGEASIDMPLSSKAEVLCAKLDNEETVGIPETSE